MSLRFWELRFISTPAGEFSPWDTWDLNMGFIICAESEDEARRIAHANGEAENEHVDVWLDSKWSTCVPLEPVEAGVVLADHVRG